jgi:uncharacterized protein YndB with AHSA1/START domain
LHILGSEAEVKRGEVEMTTIERVERFPVAPGDLWPLLTDAEGLGAWFDAEVELDARPGGRLHVVEADGVERVGVVHAVEPNARLAFTWTPTHGDGAPSAVELRLEPDGDETVLRVTETTLAIDRMPAYHPDWFDEPDAPQFRALART